MSRDVSTASFDEYVRERSFERPVVVDFWAEWCGPCRLLAPVLEQAVADRGGVIELAKVDVEAEPELAARYGVRGIPAVKAFRRGQVVGEFVGVRPRPAVDAFLDELNQPSAVERLVAELRERGEYPDVVAALEQDDYERALEALMARLEVAAPGERDDIKQLMVALFRDLGQDDPVAARYRRRLATVLY